jgi:hypothetical protein
MIKNSRLKFIILASFAAFISAESVFHPRLTGTEELIDCETKSEREVTEEATDTDSN